MTLRMLLRAGAAFIVAAAISGCQTTVGVGYGYSDPFYWNHYYWDDDIDINIDVDRPDRPDRPRPPVTKPKPPIAKPPSVRPPIHKPARPSRPGGGRLR